MHLSIRHTITTEADSPMPNYRRLRVPGGTYFFTVNLKDRSSGLLIQNIDLLRQSYVAVQQRRPFESIAVVILPDHFHCIWRLPPEDADYSIRLQLLKERFTKGLAGSTVRPVGRRKGELGIWQRRFWEHLVRDDEDLENHINYIHFNPVKHEHVTDLDDWPYSSWHRFKKVNDKLCNWSTGGGASPFG